MKDRVESLLGLRTPWISTFHSFAARILRRHIYRLEPFNASFSIYDADDSLRVIKECLQELDFATSIVTPRTLREEISRLKNRGVDDPERLPESHELRERVIRQVYTRYRRALEESNALDFDDLLLHLDRLFRTQADILDRYREQFMSIMIDEFQDTNQVQYRLGHALAVKHRNLCITGDPDQSIYSWRGADPENFRTFEKDFSDATVVMLEQNYRSTKSVLAAANELIRHNADRKSKELWTENDQGDAVQVCCFSSGEEEASEIADLVERLKREGGAAKDIAIFYRINSLSREIERALVVRGIPYAIVGAVEFFQRKEVKDILAYLRLVNNPNDLECLKRSINLPPRRVGKTTLRRLLDSAGSAGVTPLEFVLDEKLRGQLGRGQTTRGLAQFAAVFRALETRPRSPVAPLVREVLQTIGYEDYLRKNHPEDFQDRIDNVEELHSAAWQYDDRQADGEDDLQGFLEEVSLLSSVDLWEDRDDRISLMTLHSAKGLEFPMVIMAGVEEGILPLNRSQDDDIDLEEERRLCFVGMTRAMEKLYMTHARTRIRFGNLMPTLPSVFLREIAGNDGASEAVETDDETAEILTRLGRSLWDEDSEFSARRALADEDDGCEPEDCGPEPDEAGDFTVDAWEDEVLGEDPYPPGALVSHDFYGDGKVVRSSGVGGRRKITIDFEASGHKTLTVGTANLRRAGGTMNDE
jgi:DNA helicase-2/ATP-dependent DNA helicase PcrA